MVTEEIISKLLQEYGRAGVICEYIDDSAHFLVEDSGEKQSVCEKLYVVQSPEAYDYYMLRDAYEKAKNCNHKINESSCSLLMYNLGYNLNFIEGTNNMSVSKEDNIAIINALLKNRE